MMQIIQTEFGFVNEKFSQPLDLGRLLGLVGGIFDFSKVDLDSCPPATGGGPFPGGGLPPRRPALPAAPEYEGGASPHNQPEGSVVRPLAAAPHSKPVTIASRVRARLRVCARVSRWLAWISYLIQGDETKCYS